MLWLQKMSRQVSTVMTNLSTFAHEEHLAHGQSCVFVARVLHAHYCFLKVH